MGKTVIFLLASICLSGCVQKCNPVYISDSSAFERVERVKGLPIKVNTEDNRAADKKFFLKHGFITHSEKGGKNFNEYQVVQLARPSKEIIQTAFMDGFKQCGFALKDDACVVANISVEKFFCTVSGGKDNEALIELDLSLMEDNKIIYHKHISETYTQKFNAFRQIEDAEPLLSKCLSMAVEKALANPEFSNQIMANMQFFQTMMDKKAALLAQKQKKEESIRVNKLEEDKKALCDKTAIDVNETITNSNNVGRMKTATVVSNGKYPIIDKEFFGIHLGESFASLNRRFKIGTTPDDSRENYGIAFIWPVQIMSDAVQFCHVEVFEGQVEMILIELRDKSRENFEAVRTQLTNQYQNLIGDDENRCMLLPEINGNKVRITLLFEPEKSLAIVYRHYEMEEDIKAAVEKRKTEEKAAIRRAKLEALGNSL